MTSMAGSSSADAGDGTVVDGTGKRKSGIMKRSTAAQFFTNDDERPTELPSATYDLVVELLNNAAVMNKGSDKIANLRKVQELVVHKSSDLLDNFLDEMLAYQSDPSKDVKRFIIGFMEEACKKDNECLPKVLPSMVMLLADEDVNVQKKVILTVSSMFRLTLLWISKAKKTRPEMTEVWNHLLELKTLLYDMLESVNDGVRTHVVKFLEGLTLVFSKRSDESEVPKKNEDDMSIDQLSESNGIVKVSQLEEEGRVAFSSLLQFQSSPHISSINLMTVMSALSNIARQRPEFFDQVISSFEALHVNLPPTLAKSQVSSVRKNLKTLMLGLLRHNASISFVPQITTLLTDLGASQSEISKNMPKDYENRKRKAAHESSSSHSLKKSKIEIDEDDDGMTPWVDRTSKKKPEPSQKQIAIDVTAEDLLPRLQPHNVADLVLLSMVMLPESMPAQFQSTYTPIAAAGTEAQISHIARLLATQITMAGMGKGLGEVQLQAKKQTKTKEEVVEDDQPASPKQLIQTLIGGKADLEEPTVRKSKISQLPLPPASRKIKQFQLSSVTQELEESESSKLATQAVNRIMETERTAAMGHVDPQRIKLLATLSTLMGDFAKNAMREHILSDIRARQDLAFSWLYQEYANCQGYSASAAEPGNLYNYDLCLYSLLLGVMELNDHHGNLLFHRLLLEAPCITDSALTVLRTYCLNPDHTESGLKTLRQMITHRPAHRHRLLNLMLELTMDDKAEVRPVALQACQKLHSDGKMQQEIERYANHQLKTLLQPKPDPRDDGKENADSWTEETIKIHLSLHLALLPSNHKLIHELANIYTATAADIKRTILRVLETPVRGMGMESPELLTLVENCPRGSETLVMRVIHILTDKAVPSPELVERIRDLYHKRVPDVRFLIPVLNGLSKAEVMEALPKLIKLNPMVVKEVFNRLMGSHVSNDSVYHSPLTPVDLLVALHNIDSTKCDMKTIIKAANMCFSEKAIYSQEVLAIVMQQLMEQDPLPTLLMRTVIQSHSMYPRLLGFVLNILQRLIMKKAWKQKKVWEGFIRCCQRTKPQSFQVLLQLPAPQLKEVFESCPDLRAPLLEYINTLTDNQRSHINKALISVVENTEALMEVTDAEKNMSNSNGGEKEAEVPGEKIQKIDSVGTDNSGGEKISTVTVVKVLSEPRLESPRDSPKVTRSPPESHSEEAKKEEKQRVREKDDSSRDRKRGREEEDRSRGEKKRGREEEDASRERKRGREEEEGAEAEADKDIKRSSKSSRRDDPPETDDQKTKSSSSSSSTTTRSGKSLTSSSTRKSSSRKK